MLSIKRTARNISMESSSSRSVLQHSTLLILSGTTRQKSQYVYLAEKQQAIYPILPVHTDEEKDYFKELMSIYNSGGRNPDWEKLAILWCRKVNEFGQTTDGQARRHPGSIYYKTAAHLKSYFVTWNDASNRTATMRANRSTVLETRAYLTSPSRVGNIHAPPAAEPLPAIAPRIIHENQLGGIQATLNQPQMPIFPVSVPLFPTAHPGHFAADHNRYRLATTVDLSISRRTRTCVICRRSRCSGSNRRDRCPSYRG
jgi:hypothetical protein